MQVKETIKISLEIYINDTDQTFTKKELAAEIKYILKEVKESIDLVGFMAGLGRVKNVKIK